MGLRDTRDMSSFVPRRGRDVNPDRRQTDAVLYGTITKNKPTPIPIFRAPSGCKIIRASLLVDAAVASANESFWTFQLVIIPSVSAGGATGQTIGVNRVPITTTSKAMAAGVPYDITADTGFVVSDAAGVSVQPNGAATIPTQIMKQGDVLAMIVTKTGGPAQLSNLEYFVEYEVTGLTTTTSSSTTITTSTSTSSSTSTSTTTTTTTTTSTTSSTTSTSTSTSSTTTVSTTSTISTSSTTTISTTSTLSTSSTTSTTISTTTTIT